MPISNGFSTMPSIFTVHGRIGSFCACVGDFLGRIEFVEIIVMRVDLLVGDRPVERVFLVALGRIEIGGRVRQIGHVGDALRKRGARRQRQRGRAAQQQAAAVEEQMLGRGEACGISQPRRRMTFMDLNPLGMAVATGATADARAHRQVTVLRRLSETLKASIAPADRLTTLTAAEADIDSIG